MKKILSLFIFACCFTSCSIQLLAPTVSVNPSIVKYKYAYIIPTNTITGGYISGDSYSTSGYTKSTNPANVIAGVLMEKGYVILPEIQDELKNNMMIVSFGELPSTTGLTIGKSEVLLQFRDAITNELIASAKAEGTSKNEWSFIHPTEADGVKEAILRALNAIFANIH